MGKSDWNKSIVSYAERRVTGIREPIKTEYIPFLSNDDYDDLLTENIVFLDFYDTSANNAVIECIARGTPILVCRHPAVEEYLGEDYPLFYDNYRQAVELIQSESKIYQATMYLKNDKLKDRFTLSNFIADFKKSKVILGLSEKINRYNI